MNVYRGGRSLMLDLVEVVYWFTLDSSQAENLEEMGKVDPTLFSFETGRASISNVEKTGTGRPIVRVFEGREYLLTISPSNDEAGFKNFIATLDKFLAKGGGHDFEGYSAIHPLDKLRFLEVHCYKKDVPRQLNNRPLLPIPQDNFIDYCL